MTEREFTGFVEETKGIVLAAVRRYLPPGLSHAIDDVAQESYFRAFKSLRAGRFTDDSSRENWIYTIAKNECFRMIEKAGRDNERLKRFVETLAFEKVPLSAGMEDEVAFLREAISSLPEKYRRVFELLVLGFSERQIAEKLAVRTGAVKSRIHRGRELIHRSLSQRRDYEEA
jgi:RNA polymerase sigma-70 factor (ECF subfamily)